MSENYKCRAFDFSRDKETFTKFLRDRGDQSLVDFEFFPPTGCMVEYQGEAVVAGFMIKCDNKTVINTDIVGDINAPTVIRNEAVKRLRYYLEQKAKEDGYKFIIAQTSSPKLIERLEFQGYKILNKNITHLGRVLWL